MQVIRSEPRQDSTWAEVKCQSSCLPDNPTFIWYKNGQKIWRETTSLSYEDNFNSSYSCAVKGHEKFPSPPVYAPQVPSVSVSPSAEIVEGNSVNLTCSSDANPAANYTWFKKDGNPDLQLISKQQLVFSSILFSDAGQYYCTAENKLGRRTSVYKFVNVESNIRLTLLVLLLIPLFVLSLFTSWYCWIQLRKKKKLTSNTESNGTTEMKESDSGPDYENISAFRSVTAAQTDDTEEQSDSYNVYENISEVNRCSTD
ncbi:B-cell receptor CD22 B-lymphocyte cell adhesion molecule [Channa argus]|uniref:B-cell receptor CD22 B-lymphocyte cell adhesion molecule n=1 Tax=Channa argus TaxID=215402 RepID=A0A6G1PCK6_CHAAH|nr:B-cell receptor CD22 B-lymphocyte cell adhesion molecule [Channa argus]